MPTAVNIAQEVDDAVDAFADAMQPVQKDFYNRIVALTKDLSVDSAGMIKPTVANFNIIAKIRQEFQKVVYDKRFQGHVKGINQTLSDITDLQDNFFTEATPDFTQPSIIATYQKQAFTDTVQSLTGAGMSENVVNAVVDIVNTGVTEGQSFVTMSDALKEAMIGNDEIDGKLVSYSKQIVSDAMHGQARNYNARVADDLGLQWYEYVGPLKDTSREWCIALEEKRWIHESELASICRGNIDGDKVSLAGLMPDTNSENVISRCGGYNCRHHMVPVPSERVPSKIRREFEDEVSPDSDEIIDGAPDH